MTQIKVSDLRNKNDLGEDDPNRIIDLAVLNEARTILAIDLKVTIYVPERVYLATKWAMKETDFGMIKLRRIESTNCDEYFLNEILS